MSEYYQAKKTRGVYNPKINAVGREPFKLSRSKIDLFLECPRCFWIDRNLGIGRPPGFPFNLNSAVDKLLKKEFDAHRAKETQHPLMESYGLKDVVPFVHDRLGEWRTNFTGVQTFHEGTNFIVFGAVDDIWINTTNQELIVVDYKATSKDGKVNLDAEWQIGYKRQMEVYQWLLRRNGFEVSDTGYFVYCNGKTDREAFDGILEFDIELIPYTGNDGWIEGVLHDIYLCLQSSDIPNVGKDCDYCAYRQAAGKDLLKIVIAKSKVKKTKTKINDDSVPEKEFSTEK